MKKLVIIPGGFHPFHAGHKALYDAAREAFPSADVFLAATADTSSRPFPFKIKKFLARQAGVPANRFIQVKSPFRAEEITQMYDPDDTVLIFARSEKDAQQQPRPGGIKRDGSPAYLQPYQRNGLQPFAQHGYMTYLPTVQFGPGMTSATEIRAKWPGMSLDQKLAMIRQLYPAVTKDQAASKIVTMFDEIMAPTPEVQEAVLVNDPETGVQLRPDGGMGTWDEASLVSNLARKFAGMIDLIRSKRYRDLHQVLYQAGVVENMVRALAELQGFQAQQGARPLARGREIDITDYLDEK